ncbi:hypothetical protein [Micromonospora echinaurantiaca]|nr:hypothetical protein [Micromonospora echinaurantiaca]
MGDRFVALGEARQEERKTYAAAMPPPSEVAAWVDTGSVRRMYGASR